MNYSYFTRVEAVQRLKSAVDTYRLSKQRVILSCIEYDKTVFGDLAPAGYKAQDEMNFVNHSRINTKAFYDICIAVEKSEASEALLSSSYSCVNVKFEQKLDAPSFAKLCWHHTSNLFNITRFICYRVKDDEPVRVCYLCMGSHHHRPIIIYRDINSRVYCMKEDTRYLHLHSSLN